MTIGKRKRKDDATIFNTFISTLDVCSVNYPAHPISLPAPRNYPLTSGHLVDAVVNCVPRY
jgi:hypothetical protein